MTEHEMKTEYVDVEEVKQKLGLDAQPVFVSIVGRNVEFEYPVPEEDNNE